MAEGEPPRVLFAPAAGPDIGGGHVMRDLALAEVLHGRGVDVAFALPPWGERLAGRFGDPVPRILPLPRSGELQAIAAARDAFDPDVLVLDDFSLAGPDMAALRRPGLNIVVIDDLADRPYACDLLVDPSFAREAAAHDRLLPPGARRLVGPRYALLRGAFRRTAQEPPPPAAERVERVFVSFGLSDVDAIAARAVRRIRRLMPDVAVDVALASDAASLPALRAMAAADARIAVHPDARDVAPVLRAADIGIGAGGSSTWERFALGAPTLAVIVADNQRDMILRLAAAGAVEACDAAAPEFEAAFDRCVMRLQDPARRAHLRAAGRALCDGQGAGRVAEALLALLPRA